MPQPNNAQEKSKGTRWLNADARALEGDGRRVELSFSSELPYRRWFGNEILCHDEGCVDLTRVGEVATVLFHHGRDPQYGSMPIAQIEKAWIENNRGKAIVVFDEDDESEKIYQKIISGSLKGVSVGYNVTSWEEVAPGAVSSNGRFTGPCDVALKWEVIEISIEPTPADPTVGVGRAFENNNMEGENMPQPIQNPVPQPQGRENGQTDEQIRTATLEAERTRVREITTLCRDFDQEATAYIDGGNTVDEVRTAILEDMTKKRTPLTVNSVVVGRDVGEDNFRRDISDGLAMRAGIPVADASSEAKSFRGMRVRDIAVECLMRMGVQNAQRLDSDELLKRALSPQSAFTSILDNTVHKSMLNAQKAYNPTFSQWAGKGSVSDFKDAKHYQISEAGELLPISEGGEFKFDQMKDQNVSKSVLTYGRSFGFTREAMINDDLDVLSKIPQAYVIAALRGINKMVYALLGSNPVIYDGKQLFSADHNNVATPADKITTELFAQMKRLMRNQRDISGSAVLNLEPSKIIVPSSLEVAVSQFMLSLADVNGANSNVINVFRNSMDIVVDAELDRYSEKDFFMSTNSALCDTVEVTYLNGIEEPTLESNTSFERLGIEWRIYQDVGVNCLDYKGLVKGSVK